MTAILQNRHGVLRRTALGLGLAYLAALALIVFWPTPVDRNAQGSISSVVAWLHDHGIPGWFGYNTIEFSANIALFVPVGLLIVMLVGANRWWYGPLIGALGSCGIELGQLLFLPERFATINDVVANSLGASLGTLLAVGVLRLTQGPAVVVHKP